MRSIAGYVTNKNGEKDRKQIYKKLHNYFPKKFKTASNSPPQSYSAITLLPVPESQIEQPIS